MPVPSNVKTRQWLLAALDKAGTRLAALEQAGATVLEVEWTEADDTKVVAKRHDTGSTLTVSFPDGKDQIGPLTFPYGWLTS